MGGAGGAPPMAPNLYFTEYVEGTNVADALEVFNASGAAVDLAGCENRVHYQAAVGSTAVTLSGTLAANDVIVVCLGNTSFACDSIAAALPNLTGDDAVELACPVAANMVTLDITHGSPPRRAHRPSLDRRRPRRRTLDHSPGRFGRSDWHAKNGRTREVPLCKQALGALRGATP
jgi:hypothetical protein